MPRLVLDTEPTRTQPRLVLDEPTKALSVRKPRLVPDEPKETFAKSPLMQEIMQAAMAGAVSPSAPFLHFAVGRGLLGGYEPIAEKPSFRRAGMVGLGAEPEELGAAIKEAPREAKRAALGYKAEPLTEILTKLIPALKGVKEGEVPFPVAGAVGAPLSTAEMYAQASLSPNIAAPVMRLMQYAKAGRLPRAHKFRLEAPEIVKEPIPPKGFPKVKETIEIKPRVKPQAVPPVKPKAVYPEQQFKDIVTKGGGEYKGIQEFPKGAKVLFNYGEDTMALGTEELTPENVQKKIVEKKAQRAPELVEEPPEGKVTHKMPDGTIMEGPEHPGAVPESAKVTPEPPYVPEGVEPPTPPEVVQEKPDLATEAKKFKTAEEFAASQPHVRYSIRINDSHNLTAGQAIPIVGETTLETTSGEVKFFRVQDEFATAHANPVDGKPLGQNLPGKEGVYIPESSVSAESEDLLGKPLDTGDDINVKQLTSIWEQAQGKPPVSPEKPIEPPKPPVEPKPTAPQKEEPQKIRATVEEIETIRKKYGLEEVDLDTAKKWTGVFKKAKPKVKDATFIAKSIIRKHRVLENEEFAALLIRRAELEEMIDATEAGAAKAVDAGNDIEQQRQAGIMTGALEELDSITEAMRWSNREAGRALNIVKLTIEKEAAQYKLSKLLQKAKVAKGKKLTEKEAAEFKELSKKIKEFETKEKDLQKQIEALEEKLSKKDADRSFGATTKGLKRARTREVLTKDRDELFKQLNAIGYRLNDITGVTYESAKIISQLAINYFESGTTKIEDIAEQITSKLPDLTKKDVYDSVGGRIKATKGKVVSEAKLKLNELKRQARLLGQVEDAYNGVFDQVKKSPNVSPRVGELRKKLKELKDVATKSIRDEAQLNKILQKIEKLDDALMTGEGIQKKVRKIDSGAVKEAKQDLSELRRLITANEKIKDLENQLKTGDFKMPVKINRVVKRADLMEAQIKLSQLRREARERIHNLRPRTKREIFVDIVSLPRELMATADFSATGRQAAILSALDPISTLKILKESLPAFFFEDKATEIDLKIKQHENHPIRVKAGLQIKSTESVSFSKREEYFMSTLGEKIPLYGHVVRGSNRHMVSHLNLIRTMAFDRFLKLYPDATDAELKNWANYVNIASGIGDLGAFNKVASELSVAFFSPRFSMSRIQMPYEVFKYKDTPRVKKEIAKNYMKFISLVGLTLWLAHLGGADIETDPESPDWLKIKIGDTRIDPWGGLQQPARLQVLAMLKTLQAGGAYKLKRNINLSDSISRFIRYKISPWLSMLSEFIEGKSVVGELTTPTESVVGHFTPLVAEEIVDTYKSNKVLGTILAPFILLGVGVQTYKRKTIEEKQMDILKKVDKSPSYFKRLSERKKENYYRWKLAKERPNASRSEVGAYYKKYGLDKDGELSSTQYKSFKNKVSQLKTGERPKDRALAMKIKNAGRKEQKMQVIAKAIEDGDIRKSEKALFFDKLRRAGIINKQFTDELKRKFR